MAQFRQYIVLLWIGALLFSSCAVLINNDYTEVRIESEIKNTKVQILPDSEFHQTPSTFGVLRSASSLEVRFKNDTMDTVFRIKSRIDPWVYGNIYTYGFGAIIDLLHPRSRTYPRYIRLTPAGLQTFTQRQMRQRNWYIKDKGQFGLYLDWPLGNVQTCYDGSSYATGGSFIFNAGIGLNYYLSKTASVDVSFGIAAGAFGEYADATYLHRNMHSFYYRAMYQKDWRSIKLGAGLSVLQQHLVNPTEPVFFGSSGSYVQVVNEVNPVSIGPSLGFEWFAGEFITIGTNYMTGLYSFNTKPHWAYRDVVLILSFKLRIPLGARRNQEHRPHSYKIMEHP